MKLPVDGLFEQEQELMQVENERVEAIKQGDVESLESIYAPEYTAVFSLNPGSVICKVEELALQGLQARQLRSWESRDVKIRIYGNVGVVTGLAVVQDVFWGEQRHLHSQYTHVWVQRDGSWQLVRRHVNRVATLEGPST
jgi:ketosteroid isomerase-like protein